MRRLDFAKPNKLVATRGAQVDFIAHRARVRHHDGLEDCQAMQQRRIELARSDVLPTLDDRLLDPACDEIEPSPSRCLRYRRPESVCAVNGEAALNGH